MCHNDLWSYASVIAHPERHRSESIGWLRAAVLGANDGLISTSSLVVGVAAAQTERAPVLLAAVAGLVAGALSMAAGEYVSVSSQSDTEKADLDRVRGELAAAPDSEVAELTGIYVSRGLTPELAVQVAAQLTARDALAAHARDELGMSVITQARPIQAALASAAAFAIGAAPPLLLVIVVPLSALSPVVMAATALVGKLFGAPPVVSTPAAACAGLLPTHRRPTVRAARPRTRRPYLNGAAGSYIH